MQNRFVPTGPKPSDDYNLTDLESASYLKAVAARARQRFSMADETLNSLATRSRVPQPKTVFD